MAFNLDPDLFDHTTLSPAIQKFNAQISKNTAAQPKWWEIGAPAFRRLRTEGNTALPAPPLLESAIPFDIPSREPGRSIPCRVFKPEGPAANNSKHVFMHIHGGGWVLGSESTQDVGMQRRANAYSATCISVGYRLAPEHPYPAATEDCFDVAEWLIRHSKEKLGAELGFIGGESAGGHLSALTALHLLHHDDPTYSSYKLKGLVLHYGCFSMHWLPYFYSLVKREPNLILSEGIMTNFRTAFLGKDYKPEVLFDPEVSPLYADLYELRGRLPPALFTCGTEDYLLDDTLFMATKWSAAGARTVLEIVKGAVHGYTGFDPTVEGSGAGIGHKVEAEFVLGASSSG